MQQVTSIMHETAYHSGKLFFERYLTGKAQKVLDIGARNVNGTLRDHAPSGMTYIGVDLSAGPGVDRVLDDPHHLPFSDNSFDAVVSSSCLEHDQFFWVTFVEMARVIKPGGFIYLNVPSSGMYHEYPYDNWRFYPDAGIALTQWAKREGQEVHLLESGILPRDKDYWSDMILIFTKGDPAQANFPQPGIVSELQGRNIRSFGSTEVAQFTPETQDIQELEAAKQTIAALQDELARTRQELEALQKQHKATQSSYEAMQATTSWKLTAPLRHIRRLGNK